MSAVETSVVETLRARLPEYARDAKLNLQSVLQPGTLTSDQRWGVAIASAAAARNRELLDALLADAKSGVSPAVVEDALAAASLMAMNNVYYRFRHIIGKPSYEQKPARLRMQRIAKPATNKADFELFCLAVSAINGCGSASARTKQSSSKAASPRTTCSTPCGLRRW